MKNQSKVKSLLVLMSALVLFLGMKPAFAAEDPVVMLKNVTNGVTRQLGGQASSRDTQSLYQIVDQVVAPHVDFVEMAKWVVGRKAWAAANSGTQQEFIRQFKKLIINSYAGSLRAYRNHTVNFLPIRGGVAGKDRIQVSSQIKEDGRTSLRLDYRLIRQGDSWRVYDIIIEGVSLVQGYRSQFASDVQQTGVAGAILRMREHSSGIRRPR